jgi:orotidine-5'-phosphate decarboxylase
MASELADLGKIRFKSAMQTADRLIVALDVPTVAEALALVTRLGDSVRFYKVGMWLFFDPAFHALIDELVATGKQVFLDYKMYDIPETVRRGVAAVARRGARIVTVHGDPEIIAAAADGAAGTDLLVFAITVLTSQDDAALLAMGYDRTVPELIALRARTAAVAGAHGLIASASDDPAALRLQAGAPLLVATPGIRLPGAAGDDQKRVATPEAAIAAGADYLVVGRPITRAADPAAAAALVLASMGRGYRIGPNTAVPAA